MKDEKIVYQITAKGEVYRMTLCVPMYMQIALYVEDNDKPNLKGFIESIEKTIERGHRRAIENDDGTLNAADAVECGEMYRLYEYQKKRIAKNSHKL